MKNLDVYGLGNGIVDILLEISEAEFQGLELERATMRLVDESEQAALLSRFEDRTLHLASGGSVANSIIAAAQLGGKCAFATSLGDDRYSLHYKSEFDALGIEMADSLAARETTGTSAILITPDAERTMRTCLGVSSKFGQANIDAEILSRAQWIFIEGYLLSNSDQTFEGLRFALEKAKESDTRIALTLSESFIVDGFRERVDELCKSADLVFANEAEAKSFSGAQDVEGAFQALRERFPIAAVTCGEKGVLVSREGEVCSVDAFSCQPVDLTGAGDAFAGGFLFGLCHNYSLEESARGGCYLASKVISRVGARLHGDVKALWAQGVSKVN